MSDCSKHKKELFGVTDMKVVAEAIGDLHYETLAELLMQLHYKFMWDAKKDWDGKRYELSQCLTSIETHLEISAMKARDVWEICKPHMMPNEAGTK